MKDKTGVKRKRTFIGQSLKKTIGKMRSLFLQQIIKYERYFHLADPCFFKKGEHLYHSIINSDKRPSQTSYQTYIARISIPQN